MNSSQSDITWTAVEIEGHPHTGDIRELGDQHLSHRFELEAHHSLNQACVALCKLTVRRQNGAVSIGVEGADEPAVPVISW